MARVLVSSLTVAAFVALTGCATTGPHVAGKPSPKTTAAFEQLKSLAGEWESPDEKGVKRVASVISVTSNGSAVREIMFPGTPHEMTNMYHLDGDAIVATHYCAMGNQPRMRATGSDGKVFEFKFEDITNLSSKETDPMASLLLTIHDTNRISESWDTLKANGTHSVVFDLTRKQ